MVVVGRAKCVLSHHLVWYSPCGCYFDSWLHPSYLVPWCLTWESNGRWLEYLDTCTQVGDLEEAPCLGLAQLQNLWSCMERREPVGWTISFFLSSLCNSAIQIKEMICIKKDII